ncbi:MAG: endonuclease III [Alphaproteobacteria bacterium]|uniref:Endonuclease III n=1 Tax=Candidatus Nitrobium versatile TaxID=2884831 RepID=A0A953J5U2_9BACT|nr:endonuclease III [Candidatus Nitrobium versatile]
MTPEQKIAEILKRLKKEYPEPKTALHFSTPFELLVATILSAQTTDVHVNKVTSGLFAKYRSIGAYADVPLETLQEDIRSINFYRTKTKNIQAAARAVLERFGGGVPSTMEELISLPGVARKTANVLLNGAFGINEGIAVDTHVKRLANRLGLTRHDDPVKIEKDLMAITPQKEWGNLSHLLIFHGRRICTAKKPLHDRCVLYDICPSRDI